MEEEDLTLLLIVTLVFLLFLIDMSNGSRPNMTICEQRQHSVSEASPAVGYVAAIIAIFMFGSNFVPVKKIKTGDGMYIFNTMYS